jgi:hypothetical protein
MAWMVKRLSKKAAIEQAMCNELEGKIKKIIADCSQTESELAAQRIEIKQLQSSETMRTEILQASLGGARNRFEVATSEHALAVARLEDSRRQRERSIRERREEHEKRMFRLREAEQAVSIAIKRIPEWTCPASLAQQRSELNSAVGEYRDVDRRFENELNQIRASARDRQLQEFLENFGISRERHAGIHDSLIVSLKANGIETAADISPAAILAVRGFGEKRTETLVRWRAKCESKFVFDPSRQLSTKELTKARLRFAGEFGRAERRVRLVAERLKAAHSLAVEGVARAARELESLYRSAAQAKADVAEAP